ncbi:nucleoside kinase [Sporosalibacterium faouarense]|uniref:nucleoside kinase n=1 Tax=Sporosalibacterium faouarense TaxID=516123 RepID=UPI00192AF24F|nr:nucleoside kinase [Sporosalibacterium faouarense]
MENNTIKINVKNFGVYDVKNGISLDEIIEELNIKNEKKYLGAIVNNQVKRLDYEVKEDSDIEYLDLTHKDGMRIYSRTLAFIYIKACSDLFKNCRVTVEHSLSRGLYTELYNVENIELDDIKRIKDVMGKIIKQDIPIERKLVSKDEAIKIFKDMNMEEKVRLLNQRDKDTKHVYNLEGYYDTFYGYLATSTGVIDEFDLKYYHPGVIIQLPRKESDFKIPEFQEQSKLAKIFKEAETWGDILDVGYVSSLNEKILNNSIGDIIRISEALHEKKIANIADKICEDKDKRLILIAGPSSSGKTTFAQRLAIQLKVNGKKPISISLDDYFVNREDTPIDENGKFDFEALEAIDIKTFNEDLVKILEGEEVEIPTFNFLTGHREYKGKKIKADKDHPIIIEGIHGLNNKLTPSIPQKNKFKIYVSALTQLNIDGHNRIHTTDTRLIRRMVRDKNFRGNDALRTLELWDNVRRGEERNIFPYQEEADVMFNSALVYELAILRKYVEPLLMEIDKSNSFYSESKRLQKFIKYFKSVHEEQEIPCTSIIREFIGGSCFTEE